MSSTKIQKHDLDEQLVLPIEHGGTGATTVEGARTNLETSLKTYTTLEQIGITVGEETIDSIMAALSSSSMLVFRVGSTNNVSQFPANEGTCTIIKIGNTRNFLTFDHSHSGRRWLAEHYTSGGNITWSGWKEIFTTEGGMLSGCLVFGNRNWGQLQMFSHEGRYRALEADNAIIRLDVRSMLDAADRRMLDIYSPAGCADVRYAVRLLEDSSENGNRSYNLYGEHNITKGTTDIGAGSALANGCIHLVYE